VLAIVSPGQGAQKPGFLTSWLEIPSFAARITAYSTAADLDLVHYGTQADLDTITDTAIAQPLLVAAALATAAELTDMPGFPADMAGGHSVGELAAAAGAGVLSETDAISLVAVRGRAMAQAAAAEPTTMAAILGGKEDEVLAAIEAVGLTAANYNGKGQIAAGGTVAQIDALIANPPARAKVVKLAVAGAFHTKYMQPAVATLRTAAASMTAENPRIALLSNRDGQIVTDGGEYLERLVGQVAHPVRWDLCMDTMSQAGITGLLELPPAGTLTGIAKRNLRTNTNGDPVELFTLNTPDQLDEARAFVVKHSLVNELQEA
jgi:[acyl-carrier-protein] S-malonyltransferase